MINKDNNVRVASDSEVISVSAELMQKNRKAYEAMEDFCDTKLADERTANGSGKSYSLSEVAEMSGITPKDLEVVSDETIVIS